MNKVVDPSPTWKIVIGGIGVLYGVARLLTALLGGLDPAPSDAPGYDTGQILGLVFAGAVVFFGARYVRRGLTEREVSQSPGPPAENVPSPSPSEATSGSTPPPGS